MIEEEVKGRDLETPPHDDQAEQAVLGSVMKSPRAIHELIDRLRPEAFYSTRNRLIFAAMISLVRQEIDVDYHTISAELERMGAYERAGGVLYLSEINLATPSAAHIEHISRIVADHYLRRLLIQENDTSAKLAWRAQVPVDELLARTQSAVLGLSDAAGARTRSMTAGEAIERWLEGFDRESATNDRGDRIVGHSTSLRCLDKITLGLQPARLYLLSAYTSVGKSQLAHQIALHVARHHGPVLMASLEMSDQELRARAIAQETGIPVEALATHDVDEREAAAVLAVAERQSADPGSTAPVIERQAQHHRTQANLRRTLGHRGQEHHRRRSHVQRRQVVLRHVITRKAEPLSFDDELDALLELLPKRCAIGVLAFEVIPDSEFQWH